MRLHWASLWQSVGIGFGYSTHQQMLLRAVRKAGVEITPDADVAIHINTCDTFKPIPGKRNVLYTMYESTTIPDSWIAPLAGADLIVVPCTHNKALFAQYTDRPIEVCWEGVDTDVFTFKERTFPGAKPNKDGGKTEDRPAPEGKPNKDHPFTFLWSGATNPRKGTEYVMGAWDIWVRDHPELRDKTMLIMKTTQETGRTAKMEVDVRAADDGESLWKGTHEEEMPAERIVRVAGNAIVDTRRLPVKRDGVPNPLRPESLVELYHWAHAFMLPSMGEGFGLTLAEAAATGLPCIYTPWSGPKDFMSAKTGYPAKFGFKRVGAVGWKPDGTKYTSHVSWAASPDVRDIARQMYRIYIDYETALAKGRLAAAEIRKRFTWDTSAASFIAIMDRYMRGWGMEVAA